MIAGLKFLHMPLISGMYEEMKNGHIFFKTQKFLKCHFTMHLCIRSPLCSLLLYAVQNTFSVIDCHQMNVQNTVLLFSKIIILLQYDYIFWKR